MDRTTAQVRQLVQNLKLVDEQLAYLAVLTREGIKPLSRWEKPLEEESRGWLEELNLQVREVPRTVKTGKVITETIFGTTPGYLQIYIRCFDGRPVDKSAQTQRIEGFLFGFPGCCVDRFIRQGYAENGLVREDQGILFHWACRDCSVTPILVPVYREIHEFVKQC